jgi:phage protein D
MLAGQLGIRLLLLAGKTVPLPAPPDAVDAIARVEVTNDAELGDGFQITFTLGKDRAGNYGLLQSGALDPHNRVVIGIALGAIPEVLVDGIIAHHQVAPSNEPGMSTLTVMGRDLRQVLDLEEKNEKYENQPDSVIFTRLIAGYGQYGLVPQAMPTTDVPIELQRIPRQHETDLRFIQRMAERNGFVFYIEPVTFGVNRAYLGPQTRSGIPQPALTVNMDAFSNVNTLSFSQDALAPAGAEGSIVEPITKIRIPLPSLPSLRIPPLAANPTSAQRRVIVRDAANKNPAQAAATAAATVTNAPESVRGEGELDTLRYGNVLRARRPVGVRGAGHSYDGDYYVRSVKHVITSDVSYSQQFTISREGTGELLPVVRPS